jgi:mycothiol synthase
VAHGRGVAAASEVPARAAGDRWARDLGFVPVQRVLLQVLRLDEVDPARWDVAGSPGYRLDRWVGTTPDRVIESYAAARTAIADQPMGDSSYRLPEWTVERVRADGAELAQPGVEQRVIVALSADGAVAGLTIVQRHPSYHTVAFQRDTAVLEEHRGHGLGVLLKPRRLAGSAPSGRRW